MKLKTVQKLIIGLLAVEAICLIPMVKTKSILLVVVMLAAMLAQVIIELRYWRCPHCGKFLGKQLGPQHCRHCGEKVEL